MNKTLKKNFFERDTKEVARSLLSKYLVLKTKEGKKKFLITETEAYEGERDLASHARFGKNGRGRLLFGEPGIIYIYLTYGMYFMLNVIAHKKGQVGAVLIRGVQGFDGPGKLTKNLSIGKDFNAKEAALKTGLWFEESGLNVESGDILVKKRVGIDYAGEWTHKPYRFLLTASFQLFYS